MGEDHRRFGPTASREHVKRVLTGYFSEDGATSRRGNLIVRRIPVVSLYHS